MLHQHQEALRVITAVFPLASLLQQSPVAYWHVEVESLLFSSLAHPYLPPLVDGSDQHTDRLHGVEPSAILSPENPILEFAAVDASSVPDTVEVGLSTSIVPPASFMEMGTVTWNRHLS